MRKKTLNGICQCSKLDELFIHVCAEARCLSLICATPSLAKKRGKKVSRWKMGKKSFFKEKLGCKYYLFIRHEVISVFLVCKPKQSKTIEFHETLLILWSQGIAASSPTIHNFRAPRSGDRQIIRSSRTSYDLFWSSKIVKGSVGLFNMDLENHTQPTFPWF